MPRLCIAGGATYGVKSVAIMVARYAKATIMVTSYAKSGRQVSEAVREWAERAEHALVRASPVLDFPGTDAGRKRDRGGCAWVGA